MSSSESAKSETCNDSEAIKNYKCEIPECEYPAKYRRYKSSKRFCEIHKPSGAIRFNN